MPVLKEYSDSYNKEGYYVHTQIDDVPHPVTLQTPDVTVQIYRKLGYDVDDHVPNELTWKLYSADLHWTEKTGTKPDSGKIKDIEQKGPSLIDEQIDAIVSIIESYNGKYEKELNSLAKEFNGADEISDNTESGGSEGDEETLDPTDLPDLTRGIPNLRAKKYFGILFVNIDDQWTLDNLQTLEEYGCVYANFVSERFPESGLCRIKFTPKEIKEYVDIEASRSEFRGYVEQGYAPEEAIERISNRRVKRRIKQSGQLDNPMFLTMHLESLLCGGKLDRYEFIPKSRLGSNK